MTPEDMRHLAANWAQEQNLHMRDEWLMTAEICERLDESKGTAILAERERCAKVAETFPIRAETCRAWDMQPAIADAIREEPRNE